MNLFTHLLKKGAYMKKILSTLFVIAVTCSIASAKEEFSTVCANHILVPNEMDAIKLKEQQEKKIKIELLDELACEIEDTNALKVILDKTQSI